MCAYILTFISLIFSLDGNGLSKIKAISTWVNALCNNCISDQNNQENLSDLWAIMPIMLSNLFDAFSFITYKMVEHVILS